MNVNELLATAWAAVEQSGVPKELHNAAFKEAVDFLRAGSGDGRPAKESGQTRKSHTEPGGEGGRPEAGSDEQTFFSTLAHESGVDEADLRDILHLTDDAKVHVLPPTKDLGASVAEQAKTVIGLVASARAVGLGERPVNADEVRRELERKRCYQANNFAAKHLGPLKGFNTGSNRTQIVPTSKWTDDFKAAVARAHGRSENKSK